MSLPIRIRAWILIIFLIVIFFGTGVFVRFYTDWLWFSEVGYQQIFSTMLWTQVSISIFQMLAFFLIVWGNVKLAKHLSPQNLQWYDEKTIFLKDANIPVGRLYRIMFYVVLFLSFVTGAGGGSNWMDIQFFLHPSSFGSQDPLFHRDIGFYFFTLPVYKLLASWLFTTFIFTLIAIVLVYLINQAISTLHGKFSFNQKAIQHLSVILGILCLIKGFNYWLDSFDLLYTRHAVATGALYTDVYARLLAYRVLMGISVIVALVLFVNIQLRQIRTPIIAFVFWILVSILFSGIYPEIIQRFNVTPNELSKERPYIENNIKFTNDAYDLNKIKETNFPVADNLNREIINRNAATMHNVRLWDYRPLLDTYKQIQVIRQYYDFHDVDIDRYHLGNEYVQVMLSAREISIPPAARTWINERLVYTHGYGVAATRVNEVESEGLPKLLIKDIPPVTPADLKLDRPEIYFGESQSDFVLVKTKEKEFDYPKGNENAYSIYSGTAGIPLSPLRRFMFSYLFSDTDLMFTGTLLPESRILYRRNILERVKTIMPFLSYDDDPYIVVSGGKMYWMLDGYIQSNRYPYSQSYNNEFNYIRNPVKVVIDAYNGNTKFYLIDNNEPMIQSWQKIFPNAFLPFDQMPEDLKKHIRYPELLFTVQSKMYAVYHMREAQIFYNQEDKWAIPNEMFGSEKQPVEPYHVIMRLPGEPKEEFMMMMPFTPALKDNMIAWMAGKSDLPEYGKLIVYKFPKDKLVYGPMQIEARIDQDPIISSQLSLWNQKGSSVIRGNLLVIPIEDSIMYVEPLYLKSEQSQIPELKRVIVAYGERIAMEQSLEEALNVVFGGKPTPVAAVVQTEQATPVQQSLRELAKQAGQYFDKAQEKLKAGDWSGYGSEMQQLRDIINKMERQKE